jgi:hypothetical protein
MDIFEVRARREKRRTSSSMYWAMECHAREAETTTGPPRFHTSAAIECRIALLCTALWHGPWVAGANKIVRQNERSEKEEKKKQP